MTPPVTIDYYSGLTNQQLEDRVRAIRAKRVRQARPICLTVSRPGVAAGPRPVDCWYWCVHVPTSGTGEAYGDRDHPLYGRRIVHDGWAATWPQALKRGLLCIGEDVPVVTPAHPLAYTEWGDGDHLGAAIQGTVVQPITSAVANPRRTRISAQGHTMLAPADTPPPDDTPLPLPACLHCWPHTTMQPTTNGAYLCPTCGTTSGTPS